MMYGHEVRMRTRKNYKVVSLKEKSLNMTKYFMLLKYNSLATEPFFQEAACLYFLLFSLISG